MAISVSEVRFALRGTTRRYGKTNFAGRFCGHLESSSSAAVGTPTVAVRHAESRDNARGLNSLAFRQPARGAIVVNVTRCGARCCGRFWWARRWPGAERERSKGPGRSGRRGKGPGLADGNVLTFCYQGEAKRVDVWVPVAGVPMRCPPANGDVWTATLTLPDLRAGRTDLLLHAGQTGPADRSPSAAVGRVVARRHRCRWFRKISCGARSSLNGTALPWVRAQTVGISTAGNSEPIEVARDLRDRWAGNRALRGGARRAHRAGKRAADGDCGAIHSSQKPRDNPGKISPASTRTDPRQDPRACEYGPGVDPERFAAHEKFFCEEVSWAERELGRLGEPRAPGPVRLFGWRSLRGRDGSAASGSVSGTVFGFSCGLGEGEKFELGEAAAQARYTRRRARGNLTFIGERPLWPRARAAIGVGEVRLARGGARRGTVE